MSPQEIDTAAQRAEENDQMVPSPGHGEPEFRGVRIGHDAAADAFYKLAKGYFAEGRPFGSFSKSEIDLIVFEAFDNAASADESLTDFDLALKLQITPSRIQTMRTKVALRGDVERDAGVMLVKALSKGSFEFKSGKCNYESRLKIMLDSKVDQMAFADDVRRKGMFFDESFSGLVVEMSLAGVLAILLMHAFKDLNNDAIRELSQGADYYRRRLSIRANKKERDLSESQIEACELMNRLCTDVIYTSSKEAIGGTVRKSIFGIIRTVSSSGIVDMLDIASNVLPTFGGEALKSVGKAFEVLRDKFNPKE